MPVLGAGHIDDEGRMMLRNLLIERFQIKWHYENQLITAWSLIAVRPKLARADTAKRANCRRVQKDDPRDTDPVLTFCLFAGMWPRPSLLRGSSSSIRPISLTLWKTPPV